MRNILFIDDLRTPVGFEDFDNVYVARTYSEAIDALWTETFDLVSFDHDLGEEKTGYDICKYIIENNIPCDEYRIHTSNPVGRKNITDLLSRYTNAIIRQC